MAGFRERMAQLRQRATDFGGDAVSKWKQAGERSRGGSDGNTGYFGSSPLQQAMSQQQAGNTTAEGRALMDRTMNTNPSEMHRQAQMMDSGRQGEYGRGANAQGASAYTPANEDFTTETVHPTTSDGSRAEGASYEKKLDLDAGNGAELSNSVANNNVAAVNSRLMLDRYMKTDPSKMNAQGIKDMQQELNNNGYRDEDGNPLQIDGRVGPKTSAAMGNYGKARGEGGEEGPLPEKKMLLGPDGLKSPSMVYENTPYQFNNFDNPGPEHRAVMWDQQHNSGMSNPANDDNALGEDTYGEEMGLYGPAYTAGFLGKEKFK